MKFINIRCPKERISVSRNRIPRVLVGVDKKNIGAFVHIRSPILSLSTSVSKKVEAIAMFPRPSSHQ